MAAEGEEQLACRLNGDPTVAPGVGVISCTLGVVDCAVTLKFTCPKMPSESQHLTLMLCGPVVVVTEIFNEVELLVFLK